MVRSRIFDVLTGLAGLAVWAAALLLQYVSRVALEYALIVLPVAVFPLLMWIRIRAGSSPWFAFVAVNVWLPFGEAALATLVFTNIDRLAIPLAIALLASAAVAALSSVSFRAVAIAIAIVAAMLLEPHVWNGLLTSTASSRAPDVSLTLLDGRQIRLADLRGNVVVLNFWGVWCGPCVEEMPELADFAGRSHSAAVIAVNSGIGKESSEDVSRFLHAHNLNLTVAFDPSRTVYRAFAIRALPTTVIIDPNGTIRERRVGFAATARYESWLTTETARLVVLRPALRGSG